MGICTTIQIRCNVKRESGLELKRYIENGCIGPIGNIGEREAQRLFKQVDDNVNDCQISLSTNCYEKNENEPIKYLDTVFLNISIKMKMYDDEDRLLLDWINNNYADNGIEDEVYGIKITERVNRNDRQEAYLIVYENGKLIYKETNL